MKVWIAAFCLLICLTGCSRRISADMIKESQERSSIKTLLLYALVEAATNTANIHTSGDLRRSLDSAGFMASLDAHDRSNVFFNPDIKAWVSHSATFDSGDCAIILRVSETDYLAIDFTGLITKAKTNPAIWSK